jgi:protein-tyrosine phosphatase
MLHGRSLRYAFAFVSLAGPAILFGVSGGISGLVLVWFGATLLAVAANYALPNHCSIFRKTNGRLTIMRKIILLPFLALLYGTWHLLRKTSNEAPYAELAPGFLIGRRLLPSEYPPIQTLVDLTAEFDEHVPSGAKLLVFPILDGAPVNPEGLKAIARQIAASAEPLYLHCAQGHGRTSMIAAAVLIERRLAANVNDALAQIANVRPGAKPNRDQRAALSIAYPDPTPIRLERAEST